MSKRRIPYVLAAASIVVAGLTAFLIGRYALSKDAPAEAQVSPTGTPVIVEKPPHPSIAAAMTAIAEDNTKPRFVGELNGITFLGMGTPVPRSGKIACSNADLREVPSIQAGSAIRGSELDFDVTYLPPGLSLARETATVCNEEVIAAGRVYEGSSGRLLSIVRSKAAPVSVAYVSRDRLKPLTIGGRPSVLIEPIGFSPTGIIMRDEMGTLWKISADEIDVEEALEIAKGVR